MRTWSYARTLGLTIALACAGHAGWTQAAPAAGAVQTSPGDAEVEAADEFIGRALILRGFYAAGDLTYDAQGKVQGSPKVVDWTLAGMNLEKVTRRGDGQLELDGTRVAIRYNPDQHVFERHPQKEDHLKVIVPAVDGPSVRAAMAKIFSVGMDPAMERSTPQYWRHYFLPAADWPADESPAATVPLTTTTPPPAGLVMPKVDKVAEPEYTSDAQRDKVRGAVQLRVVVGADGVPHRISIRQPLGYGLDQRAVEAFSKYRFHPGTLDGKPVSVEMLVNEQFEFVAAPVFK